ncbi:MAG: hypothetical protein E7350_00590, partial [Clostridiales bacterium]|nr:hypothetical protein [Clostridiales bacterium]
MKRKNLRMRLASLAVFLLIGVMGVTGVASSYLGNTASNTVIPTNSAITASTNSDFDLSTVINKDIVIESAAKIGDNETVGLIVELEGETLVDMYAADPMGYATFQEYRLSKEGKAAAQALINKQNAVYNKIARQADVELKYNYVNAMNGFAIDFTYGDRDLITKIAKKANVVSTQISERYLQPETTVVTNEVAAHETGIFDSAYAIEQGIAGQGQVVAILDTGLDWEHVAFQPDHELFDLEHNTLKFTKDTVAAVIDDLSASKTFIENLTVNEVYRNEKVPYVFDYADYDPEVNTHVENSHGTHVAGIVAGHSDDPFQDKNGNGEFDRDATGEDDEHYYDDKGEVITGITGVAPMAQLAIFKVFPDGTGGAESYAMLGAVEDCITLGVDVINMSLGGDCGFQDETYGKDSVFSVYKRLEQVGISLVVAAGFVLEAAI